MSKGKVERNLADKIPWEDALKLIWEQVHSIAKNHIQLNGYHILWATIIILHDLYSTNSLRTALQGK